CPLLGNGYPPRPASFSPRRSPGSWEPCTRSVQANSSPEILSHTPPHGVEVTSRRRVVGSASPRSMDVPESRLVSLPFGADASDKPLLVVKKRMNTALELAVFVVIVRQEAFFRIRRTGNF